MPKIPCEWSDILSTENANQVVERIILLLQCERYCSAEADGDKLFVIQTGRCLNYLKRPNVLVLGDKITILDTGGGLSIRFGSQLRFEYRKLTVTDLNYRLGIAVE